MKVTLAAALLLAPLLLGAGNPPAAGRFERTATGVLVTPASGAAARVRVDVIDDRILHVSALPANGPEPQASLMVTARPDPAAAFSVTEQAGKLLLKTGAATAEVDLATGLVAFRDAQGRQVLAERDRAAFEPVDVQGRHYVAVRQLFNPGTYEAFYGLGQHQNAQMDLNGQDVVLAQHNMDVAVPFVLSSRNYGVLWDNNSITRFGNPTPYAPASRDLELRDAAGKPGGLTASYFVDGKLKARRVEPDINYQFFRDLARRPAGLQGERVSTSSAQHVDIAGESVRWEGSLVARKSGLHTFQLYASSYFKLTVDGKVLLDRWRQNWNPWYHNVQVPMTAGKPVRVRVDWTPNDGFIALLHDDPLPPAERHSLAFASELGQGVDYYYVGGANLAEVIAGYRRLTGKAVLLPRWAYGFWQSRQRYKDQQEILDVAGEYRRRQLPLDNVVEDWFYWREDDWGSHRFDPARFPDPKGMIDKLHGEHAHFMISVWPKFYTTTDTYKELDALGHIYRRNVEQGVHDWVGEHGYLNSFYDPYSPEARELYWRRIHERLGVLGVDAWWLDATEPDVHSNVDIEETKLRDGPTAMGPGAAFFNSYPLLHTQGVYEGARRDDPDKRVMILTRSGFGGLQRNAAAVWSGDTASRWTDLGNQVAAGLGLSMAGIPNWSFDIGGFTMEARYQKPNAADLEEWRELNLRWFQFGAFVPLMRSHGEEPFREIYTLAPEGSEVYQALAWYDRLRYRLMPYTYTLAADTWHRDGSILRALPMDFPADPKVRDINDEYLYGPAFLVAPVHEYRARTRSVYLPAGSDWYDFHTGRRHAGGQRIQAAAPLARMPLFVRAGAIVPVGPAIQYTGEKPEGPVTLQVYTGANGHFELYDDDGVTYGYERGQSSRIPVDYDEATGTLRIGARTGSFPGMPARFTLRVRFIAPGSAAPADLDAAADRSFSYTGAAISVRRGEAHPALWPATHSVGLVDAATEKRVGALLARLSLEEKVGQVVQGDISTIRPEDLRRYPLGSILAGGSSPPLGADDRSPAPAWIATARAFRAVSLEARPGHVPIPVLFGIDAVHGNSNVVGATVFAHNVGLGAMHDPALMRRIGEVTAEETAASGIDWAFGPTLTVPQDVRWGRSYEGYSEDPALVRSYAGELVRGLQGDVAAGHLLQKGRVAASAKHFLGDGGTRDGTDQGDADIDERELIDTHAQGYLSAIPAGTLTVMASFSNWQGRKMHGNASLLTGVLKQRFGFDGFVVGDWNGHGQVPGCTPGDCAAAFNAGLDMFMAPDHWRELFDATLAEARDGRIPLARLDDAVRRILRVKAKLGLLEPARPWEGRLDAIGSPAHRAVARQAVRESLVLLKNDGGLLPLHSDAHVLVAGAAADDIGRQCGGWTLSWQGTGNHNSDFPNGESILAGLHDALAASGGGTEFSADGHYTRKPDVAIVVYGETPYAEMLGDVRHLEFQPGEHADLALLRRLKADGIPVVSVFLSGRPMWVNAELNASDAFVAAWFPGSEGGGVADVLVGTADGQPRHPFTGSLSFSWPRTATQAPLHKGVAGYDPLFPVGYGLKGGQSTALAPLPEASDVGGAAWNVDRYFQRGRTPEPWAFQFAPAGAQGGSITMRSVDAGGMQEAGRSFQWSGTQAASLAIGGAPVDLTRQANGELVLRLEYRVDVPPSGPVRFAMACTPACAGSDLDLTPVFAAAKVGEWQEVKLKLGCLRDAGVDMSAVSAPLVLGTTGPFAITLLSAGLSADGVGAICPARAPAP